VHTVFGTQVDIKTHSLDLTFSIYKMECVSFLLENQLASVKSVSRDFFHITLRCGDRFVKIMRHISGILRYLD
jgi:hypothetical protein